MTTISHIKTRWQQFRWKKTAIAAAGIVIIAIIAAASQKEPEETAENPLPAVEASAAGKLAEDARVERTGIIEPTLNAPLIARAGGRVTSLKTAIGNSAVGGQILIEIDGGSTPSVARAQAAGASRSAALFNDIQKQAIAAVDNAVKIAELNLDAARSGREISNSLQTVQTASAAKAVEQAKQQVRTTSATRAGFSNVDDIQVLIDAAEIGVAAARLAEQQAELATQLSSRQQDDGLEQARRALTNAQIIKLRTQADLASQRAGLATQLDIASQQVRASQVTAPFSGKITALTVRVGSYINPGQQVGSMVGDAPTTAIRTEVPASVKSSITPNQAVSIKTGRSEYTGIITGIAPAPSSETLLWQVDIAITDPVHETDLYKSARISFPINSTRTGTRLIPLDALNIRADGIVVLTVEDGGIIRQVPAAVLDYHGDFVEIESPDISASTLIVIKGNRTLTEGDTITLTNGS